MEAILAIAVALLAVTGVTICITKPKYALVPVLMLFPAEQILMGYIPELRWKYSGTVNVVVGLIAVFGVGYKFFRRSNDFSGSKNPTTHFVAGLYAYILAAFLWTPARDSAIFFLAQNWPYFVLMFVIAPLLVSRLDDMADINKALIVVGGVLMALMLINPNARYINDRFVIDLGYQPGFGQIASNPLAIADAGGTLAIIAALYRPSGTRPFFLLVRLAGVILGLTLALMSGSRGQLIVSLGVIALMAPFATGSKNPLRVIGSLLVVGLAVAVLMYVFQNVLIGIAKDRWNEHGTAQGLGERMAMATSLLEAYGSNPAYWPMGLGAAAFNAYFTYRPEGLEHWYPHNIVLEAVAEYGIPGITLLAGVMFTSFRSSMRLVTLAGPDRSRRSSAVLLLGLLTFQFMMSLKQGSLLGFPPLFLHCLVIARVRANEEAAYQQALLEYDRFEQDLEQEQRPQGEPEWAAEPA